jgi:hypothetical protein
VNLRFVQREAGWELVDDDRSGVTVAVLKSETEIVALRAFCERFAESGGRLPEHFHVDFRGDRYVITPVESPENRLTLVVRGPGGSCSIETAIVLPK